MIAPVEIRRGDLAVTFQWRGDRWSHTVACGSASARCLLESSEGTDEDPWPASPPFVNLHVEGPSHSPRRIFLLGMAGHGHWSACVKGSDTAGDAIEFDVACRAAGTWGRLGSSYLVLAAFEPDVVESVPTSEIGAPAALRQRIVLGGAAELWSCDDQEGCLAMLGPDRIWIGPSTDVPSEHAFGQAPNHGVGAAKAESRTHRWKYAIRALN